MRRHTIAIPAGGGDMHIICQSPHSGRRLARIHDLRHTFGTNLQIATGACGSSGAGLPIARSRQPRSTRTSSTITLRGHDDRREEALLPRSDAQVEAEHITVEGWCGIPHINSPQ